MSARKKLAQQEELFRDGSAGGYSNRGARVPYEVRSTGKTRRQACAVCHQSCTHEAVTMAGSLAGRQVLWQPVPHCPTCGTEGDACQLYAKPSDGGIHALCQAHRQAGGR